MTRTLVRVPLRRRSTVYSTFKCTQSRFVALLICSCILALVVYGRYIHLNLEAEFEGNNDEEIKHVMLDIKSPVSISNNDTDTIVQIGGFSISLTPEQANVFQVYQNHHVVHGVYVPTPRYPRNWRASKNEVGFGCGNNTDIMNVTMYRLDGIGQQLLATMRVIANVLRNPTKYNFYYFPFQYRMTDRITDLSQIERFINIGYGERNIFNKSDPCRCCHFQPFQKYENGLFNDTVKEYLRNKYFSNKQHLKGYNNSVFNVAVHIRRAMNIESDKSWRIISNSYFSTIMQYLFNSNITTKAMVFHVYSHGSFKRNESEKAFNSYLFSTQYHINTALNLTFHGMVTADAFIASRSALSYTAAILSDSKYIFYPITARQKKDQWQSLEDIVSNQWIPCHFKGKILCLPPNETRQKD
eukprot:113675_1